MTGPHDPGFVGEALSALEDRELPLLSWGVTSGALSRDEVLEILDNHLATNPVAPPTTAESMLAFLTSKALLLQLPGTSPPRYRTRLAETVRLIADLRQLFPPRDLESPPSRWWDRGRPLVADFRLHVAPRRYPRRDLDPTAALRSLKDAGDWSPLQAEVAAAQVGSLQLAKFQVAAAGSVVAAAMAGQSRGVIIGAGTGSGKTLAFYLPACTLMAERALPGRFGVQTLALYPRTELLRDQLREAVRAAQAVRGVMLGHGRRPLRIGALYGDTPYDGNDQRLRPGRELSQVWRRRGDGLACPYLSCPVCNSQLIWPDLDRQEGREALRCTSCDAAVSDDELALTRESMRRRPPDLLFTTTEMLSQRATDGTLGRIMGWSGGPGPRLVLLDEIHTYAGVHGAQVALLLRRWRHAVRTPVTFVGLSATLQNGARFFARLIGVPEAAVDDIQAAPEELKARGREYAIALRGDPVGGASLLSTSIQAAMLHGRVLDRRDAEYLHGSTGFVFTDDLDVTNRLYDDLRDAEGRQQRRGARRLRGTVLAGLRSPDAPFAAERYRDGQSWDLVQRIGHPLTPAGDAGELRVGRTSSQDAGVDANADLIVATAALEVGFNDPRVGLVLQHKAPHDPAAFLQRRGRAGRRTEMRPWTVVILSDYGRDRMAYQAYDTLFAPQLPARNLPIGNRFVLKIHATHALMDWLGHRLLVSGERIDPRQVLRAPADGRRPDLGALRPVADLLESLLRDETVQDDLARHLQYALDLRPEEVQALLWDQPRSLLLAVVPTALRRLRTEWRPVAEDPGARPRDLLPEFITRALFDPLNVPEVRLHQPLQDADDEHMPIGSALREAVPGRVSRRFGYRHDQDRTWLPLPEWDQLAELSAFVTSGVSQGPWTPHGGTAVQVVRPLTITLSTPPREVADNAQAAQRWCSELVMPEAGTVPGDVPKPSSWSDRVLAVGFATHAAGNPLQVRRMTLGAHCETRYQDGRTETRTIAYGLDGVPAALGFQLPVDAVRFEIAPLNLDDSAVRAYLDAPSWRTLAFLTEFAEDPRLNEVANTFQRQWLSLVYLTAFALAGLDETRTPAAIHAGLAGGAWRTELRRILTVLYRDADPDGNSNPGPERLLSTLEDLSHDERVCATLDRHGRLLLAAEMPALTGRLARRAYSQTLAAAILAAALRAIPDAQDRDLTVDVVAGPIDTDPTTIWLSETNPGGFGLVEQLVQYYARDPRRFWGLVQTTLGPSEYEQVDAALTRLLQHLREAPMGDAATAIARLRAAPDVAGADDALRDLLRAWSAEEGRPPRSAVAALSTRLLRPGSTPATDALALALVGAWDQLQQRLGFEVDARVIAYAVGSGRLQLDAPGGRRTGDQLFSLLWPRGFQARNQHLQHYQPFAPPPVLDRLLVGAAHDERLPRLDVSTDGWEQQYRVAIAGRGAVELTASAMRLDDLAGAVRVVPAIPVDLDVLRVYGSVRGFRRVGDRAEARVELGETLQ
jgi:ATP-dependent helicase Lhr and Lhr-like helicase